MKKTKKIQETIQLKRLGNGMVLARYTTWGLSAEGKNITLALLNLLLKITSQIDTKSPCVGTERPEKGHKK